MSGNAGIFGWIRDGVRQSVLLGVSDAMETLGTPEADRELNPVLMGIIKQSNTGATAKLSVASESAKRLTGSTGKKRLGRSLKDINSNTPSS